VINAVESVDPRRFNQEAAYVAALAQALDGTAYRGTDASIVFRSTVYDDRGRNSAERRFGADFAIVARIASPDDFIEKVILVQAKRGEIEDLSRSQLDELKTQIRRMRQLVMAPKVMEIPESSGIRTPRMISGNQIHDDNAYRPMSLANYIVARVLTTLDGDTRPDFVASVEDSTLAKVVTIAKLLD